MNISPFAKNLLIIIILSLNAYCIYTSLKYGSRLGFVLAVGSVIALFYCLRLLKRLKDSEEDESY